MSLQPLISFVRYVRNDGYIADLVERINLSNKILADAASNASIPIEILHVEWNPPEDEPRLEKVIAPLVGYDGVIANIVTVPARYHHGLKEAHLGGMHASRALNVGYRRARGEFVTPTPADGFITPETFAWIAKYGLRQKRVYRLNRSNILHDCLPRLCELSSDPEAFFQTCADNVLESFGPQDDVLQGVLGLPLRHTNAAGDFMLMHKVHWFDLRGQPEDFGIRCLDIDSVAMQATATHGLEEIRLPNACRIFKPIHEKMTASSIVADWTVWARFTSRLIRFFTARRATQAFWRGIFDVPKRRDIITDEIYPSFERRFYLRAWYWQKTGRPAIMNKMRNWGLGNEDLEEKSI